MIHIEGMGLLGSLLAHNLDRRGIEFTWHDTDRPVNAWTASTGMVYPAGDDRSQTGLAGWRRWATEEWAHGIVEEVAYVYHHKNPPHEGRYTAHDLGDMRVAPRSAGAYAVNVQVLVEAARRMYRTRRRPHIAGETLVRAHGFTERLGKHMWGWTVPVELQPPDDVNAASHGLRPAFYSRRNRFQMVYAYPIAGIPNRWWAGSTLVGQTDPHTLDAEKHYARWLEGWNINFPRIPVIGRGDPRQGWRPRPTVEPDDAHLVTRDSDVLTFPPLWHSGVRWAPLVIDQAVRMLR